MFSHSVEVKTNGLLYFLVGENRGGISANFLHTFVLAICAPKVHRQKILWTNRSLEHV